MSEPSSRSLEQARELLHGRVFEEAQIAVALALDAARAEERERVLAATPETIEAMARAVWNTVDLPDDPPDVVKDEMRAALAALRARMVDSPRKSEERASLMLCGSARPIKRTEPAR